jgi:hypothetical protein
MKSAWRLGHCAESRTRPVVPVEDDHLIYLPVLGWQGRQRSFKPRTRPYFLAEGAYRPRLRRLVGLSDYPLCPRL